jgi:uncharacterized protein
MHILCDISHPAHVHFFRNAVNLWREHGHQVTIVSRDKDITTYLLDHYGYDHICISRMRRGKIGLALELLEHEGKLFCLSQKNTPDIFLEIAGTFIVHAASMLNRPSVVFYDTEHAKLSNSITYPFASVICTPSCYIGDLGKKHVRYLGYQELAYLHPNYFKPNENILNELKIQNGDPFYVVRFVSWEASHDIGHGGFTIANKRELIRQLSKLGRVFITSERGLPEEFEAYRMSICPTKIHDLLAFSNLYIGEGATMATEACILGTPSIYMNTLTAGTIEELANKYQMLYRYTDGDAAIDKAVELASNSMAKIVQTEKRKIFLNDKIDVTAWMVEFVESYTTMHS